MLYGSAWTPTILLASVRERCDKFSIERVTELKKICFSVTDCASGYRVSPTLQQLPFAGAVRDQWANTTCEAPTTSRAVALLHFAAVGGHSEAQLALGLR